MVKKFKLIKEYPGSPKLGIIVETNEYNFLSFIPNDDKFYGIYPENYPEFWEKVIKKEYKIISWYFGDMNITKNPDGSAREYFIYSVKRLSDGEIFTIGDNVEYYHRNTKIESIYYNEHDLLSFKVEGNSAPLTGVFGTSKLEKVKEVLFTTEDGVEISDSEQEVYWLEVGKYITHGKKAINMKNKIDNLYFKNHIKVFSTEKAAQNYIKLHKPVLSYNDVLELYDLDPCPRQVFKNKLTELTKSKL